VCQTIIRLVNDVLQLESGVPLPSPELLKRRILIKNKKHHTHTSESLQFWCVNMKGSEELKSEKRLMRYDLFLEMGLTEAAVAYGVRCNCCIHDNESFQ
jgi:hypothetical protein